MRRRSVHSVVSRFPRLAGTALAVLASVPAARADGGAVHTRLESSVPASDAVLEASPPRIELRFSGAVDSRLSSILLVLPSGDSISVAVVADPADDRLLVARPPQLPAGRTTVRWRTVSADGHPVEGEFTFTVRAASTEAVGTPSGSSAAADTVGGETPPAAPGGVRAVWSSAEAGAAPPQSSEPSPAATLLPGLALACLLGFAGLLWFAGAGPLWDEPRIRRAVIVLGWAAVILLAADLAVWAGRVRAPGTGIQGMWHALTSTPGLAATGPVALAALAIILASRSGRLAAVLALLAVLTGAAGGHPAAISPGLAVSANAVHLGAAAIWTGGLLLLALLPAGPADGSRSWTLPSVASAVSSAALLAVVLIAGSGIVQSVVFVGSLDRYVTSAYGRVVLLKAAGLLVLMAFGAWHRRRTLPGLADAAEGEADRAGTALRATVRLETAVMLLVVLIAAYLARLSPPSGR